METQVFNIPSHNLDKLNKLVRKMNKKAERAGTGEIKLTHLSETVERNADGSVTIFHQVAVEGETPKIAGWTFVARLDHNSDPTGDSNFVYVMPGQHLPAEHYTADANCDHCGFKRKRRDTYILRNDSDTRSHVHGKHTNCYPIGYMLQVGRTCVQDFIGLDPAKVIAQAERLAGLAKAAKEAETGSLDVPFNQRHYDLLTYLNFVAQQVRVRGWKGRKEAYEQSVPATADNALTAMFRHDMNIYGGGPSDIDFERAAEALQYASTLDSTASNYNHNVVTMIKTGYIDWKATGIAASIIKIYDNWLEKKARESANVNLTNSDYVGEIGKRINGRVKVIGKTLKEGFYGTTKIIRMASVNRGDLIVTFAKGDKFNPNIGDEIEIRATVKNHQVYNNIKQTIVDRAAIIQ